MDPLVRGMWSRRGLGNIVELEVPKRNGSGTRSQTDRRAPRQRSQLRRTSERRRRLDARPRGRRPWHGPLPQRRRVALRRDSAWQLGEEREQAIRATGQHPFPGNLVYRLGRRQVAAVGVYFRLDDTTPR